MCQECQENDIVGYFSVQEGVKLVSEAKKCSELKHPLDRRIIELMKKKQKPFEMKNLLDVEKSKLGLEAFRNSQIRQDMMNGALKPGEQIWIYHDSTFDPCNLMARMNPYAHVIIYIGQRRMSTRLFTYLRHPSQEVS